MYGQPIHSLFSVNHDHCIIQGSIYEIYKSKYKLQALRMIELHWCEIMMYRSDFLIQIHSLPGNILFGSQGLL